MFDFAASLLILILQVKQWMAHAIYCPCFIM